MTLTHFDEHGRAHMVDVGNKDITVRIAIAHSIVYMEPQTLDMIINNQHKKGDVLSVAQIAGIMAAKQTAVLIPMCHNINLDSCDIGFDIIRDLNAIEITATVKTSGKTGVEMEALTAVSIAALTIYDMCKAVDRSMVIDSTRLIHKSGGKSGEYNREDENQWQK